MIWNNAAEKGLPRITKNYKLKRGQRDIWYWEVSYEWIDVVISLTKGHDKVELEKLSQLIL